VSDQEITLTLNKREVIRKGLNRLKKEGLVPAVIQNPGKESVIVSGSLIDLIKVYKQVGKRHPVSVKVGSNNYLTIIKDIDFEPKKHQLRHVVFSIIKQDEKVETEVPVVLVGDAPAAKLGLYIEKHLEHISIEALPKDLPDEISINIDNLAQVGDKITVADIVAPRGVAIMAEPEFPMVSVEEPRIQAEEEPIAEETATESAATESSEEE